jgi:hypothetical protein
MRLAKPQGLKECPAIAELADMLEALHPNVGLWTTVHASPGTRHTAGVAIDIMLDVTKTDQRTLGHRLIDAFVKHQAAMMWSHILYSDFIGGKISYFQVPAGRGGYGGKPFVRQPYTNDTRHGDHIHMDWVDFNQKNTGAEYQRIPYKWTENAKKTGFRGLIEKEIAGPSAGPVGPPPPISTTTAAAGWWEVLWRGTKYYYFLNPTGGAGWTKTAPKKPTDPLVNPSDRGNYMLDDRSLILNWSTSGTIETFSHPVGGRMTGVWRGLEPLSARKL